MASIFDNTAIFNPEVFRKALENILSTEKTELVNAFTRNGDPELARMFPEQAGGNVATIVIEGNLGDNEQNYDGSTTIVPTGVLNYSQKVIAVGRVHSWKEKDFIPSISGRSGLDAQAYQVAMRKLLAIKKVGLSTLKGLFSSGGVLASKVKSVSTVAATDGNDAIVAAAGDLGEEFDLCVMDSYYAGQLANLKLLDYAKYTDVNGIERYDQRIGYWGGRLVLIDDAVGTNSGASATVHNVYFFGFRSWKYTELEVKYPFEMARDSFTAGGVDSLIARQRFVLAPYGVSWKGSSSIVSPTNAQLETVSNWELVEDANGTDIDTKIIPFAAIQLTIA